MTSGWWELNSTIELNNVDREHIARLIKDGYTEGELIQEDD